MHEPIGSRIRSLFREAGRRGVLGATIVAGAAAFALLESAQLLVALGQLPLWTLDASVVAIVAGFLLAVALRWSFVKTADGFRRASALTGEWPAPGPRRRTLVVALAAIGVVVWALRPREGIVARGAESIAILPFDVQGEGVNHLAEGLPDLLAIDLGEIESVRIANSRIVLRLARERPSAGDSAAVFPADLARAAAVGSVLSGSVTGNGADLSITAELRRADGKPMAAASVEGPSADLLALVDDVSRHLTERVWRSRAPLPDFDLRALTTGRAGALDHYLRGEALFRRAQWRAAAAAFTRAVRADTSFALAYARLADTYGWADGAFSEQAALSADPAHSLGGALPRRRSRLVTARWLAGSGGGGAAAADSVRAILERYPDDMEALHLLAEIGFHGRAARSIGIDSLTRPVERLLALDSTMTAGLVRPIETALQFGDRMRFERYLGVAEATGLSRAPDLRRAGAALWLTPETRGTVARELMAEHGSAFR